MKVTALQGRNFELYFLINVTQCVGKDVVSIASVLLLFTVVHGAAFRLEL